MGFYIEACNVILNINNLQNELLTGSLIQIQMSNK